MDIKTAPLALEPRFTHRGVAGSRVLGHSPGAGGVGVCEFGVLASFGAVVGATFGGLFLGGSPNGRSLDGGSGIGSARPVGGVGVGHFSAAGESVDAAVARMATVLHTGEASARESLAAGQCRWSMGA